MSCTATASTVGSDDSESSLTRILFLLKWSTSAFALSGARCGLRLTSLAHDFCHLILLRFLARMIRIRVRESTRDGRMRVRSCIRRMSLQITMREILRSIRGMITYVKLSKLSLSSSLKNCTSSRMSSSVHFLVHRFLAKGSTCATSIAGRFFAGALITRFYIAQYR